MSAPILLHVTYDELQFDPENNTHIAQLRVGSEIVFESKFRSYEDHGRDEQAAEAIAEALKILFGRLTP